MSRLQQQLGGYAAFMGWLFRDAFLRYRWRLSLMVLANVLGLAAQALAVFAAYRYAQALETGQLVQYLGATVAPRQSFGLLVATAVAVLALMAASGILVAYARVAATRMAYAYGQHCAQRAYLLASTLPSRAAPQASAELNFARLSELTKRDPAILNAVVRILFYSLLPIGTAVVAGVALMVIDATLSLIISGVLAVAALFLYRISIRGAAQRATVRQRWRDLVVERRLLDLRVAQSPAPIRPAEGWAMRAFDGKTAAGYEGVVVGQRATVERASFVAQVAMGCAIFIILLVQGGAMLRSESNWSALLVYLAALFYFANSFAKVARALISVNRYYPELSSHARFVERARPAQAGDAAPMPGRFRLEAPFLGEPARTLEAAAGERLALLLPSEVSRYALAPLAVALRGYRADGTLDPVAPIWFASPDIASGGGTLRESIGLAPEYDAGRLEADLAALGVPGAHGLLGRRLDLPRGALEPDVLAREVVFLAGALSGIRNGCTVLALEAQELQRLAPAVRDKLLARAAGALLLVVYPVERFEAAGECGETAAIVAGAEKIYGWSTIADLRRKDERPMRAIAQATREPRVRAPQPADADELEQLL
jgi:hypothetical protein